MGLVEFRLSLVGFSGVWVSLGDFRWVLLILVGFG